MRWNESDLFSQAIIDALHIGKEIENQFLLVKPKKIDSRWS